MKNWTKDILQLADGIEVYWTQTTQQPEKIVPIQQVDGRSHGEHCQINRTDNE